MRLLLIDDEPLIGVLVRRIAEMSGFDVMTTIDPDAFKSACLSFRPDVISLDLAMPDCDGIELLRYLAEIGCSARILIASAFDNKMLEAARDLGEARGLNMAGIIAKPMDLGELRQLFDALHHAMSDA